MCGLARWFVRPVFPSLAGGSKYAQLFDRLDKLHEYLFQEVSRVSGT